MLVCRMIALPQAFQKVCFEFAEFFCQALHLTGEYVLIYEKIQAKLLTLCLK